jgi:hypothetical protein
MPAVLKMISILHFGRNAKYLKQTIQFFFRFAERERVQEQLARSKPMSVCFNLPPGRLARVESMLNECRTAGWFR